MAGHTIMTSSTLDYHREEPPLLPTEATNSQTYILIAEPNPELQSVYCLPYVATVQGL
jgi:hypothetical protein